MLQKRATRERSCSVCGKVEIVRADNPGIRCKKCGSKPGGEAAAAAQREKFPRNECPTCGVSIRGTRKYCSRDCQLKAWRTDSIDALPLPQPKVVSELELSRAAEFLVCAELTLAGYPSYPSGAGLPYDVVADLGHRLIKLQVKATRGPRAIPQRAKYTPGYLFQIRKCGRGGRQRYEAGDFDGFALVALDIRQIAYIPLKEFGLQTIHLRPPGFAGSKWSRRQQCISDYPFEDILDETGETFEQVKARRLDVV